MHLPQVALSSVVGNIYGDVSEKKGLLVQGELVYCALGPLLTYVHLCYM